MVSYVMRNLFKITAKIKMLKTIVNFIDFKSIYENFICKNLSELFSMFSYLFVLGNKCAFSVCDISIADNLSHLNYFFKTQEAKIIIN